MKKYILSLIILFGAFTIGFFYSKASYVFATSNSCISTGPQCGTDNGNKTVKVCPQGYTENEHNSTPKDCHKFSNWSLDYAYFVDSVISCHTGVIDYSACTPEESCTESCGYEGGQVADGKGGFKTCEATPVCQVDACFNIEGFQEVIPEGYHLEEDFGCIVDTPPAGPAPEVIRVETPTTEAGAPVCTDVAPAKIPNIFVVNAGVGKLEVRWIPTGGDKAHIFYGLEVGKPLFSLIDTPNDGVEVIGSLVSGKHYWFSVVNGSGCAWSSLSDWYDPIVE